MMRSETKLQVLSRSTKQFRRRQESQKSFHSIEVLWKLNADLKFLLSLEILNRRAAKELGLSESFTVIPRMQLLKPPTHQGFRPTRTVSGALMLVVWRDLGKVPIRSM